MADAAPHERDGAVEPEPDLPTRQEPDLMTTTTEPETYVLRPDGSIVLPDDDGDPGYYLQPEQAEELANFIYANLHAIREAQDKARRLTAYTVLSQLIASGLPAPTSTRLRWDGLLTIDVEENYDTWVAAVDGTDDIDEHPTLGRRRSHRTSHLVIEDDWVAAEQVSA